MTIARKRMLPILASMAVLAHPPGASAETRFPPSGAQGDAGADLRCPEGSFLTGFEGRTGAWIDQIQLRCSRISQDGTAEPSFVPDGSALGGGGGGPNRSECDAGAVVASISVRPTSDQKKVEELDGPCLRLRDGAMVAQVRFMGVGVENSGLGVGDVKIWPSANYSCPAGETPTGLSVRYGAHVNAIGLICNTVARTAAAAPPPPPAPKEKPVKVIGGGTGHAAVGNTSFAGTYQTVTSSNGHFELTLTLVPDKHPATFTGTFINTDGAHQYDGDLNGMIVPTTVRLYFNYTQKNGETGKGSFGLSNDGTRLSGEGDHNGANGPIHYTWNGTRESDAN